MLLVTIRDLSGMFVPNETVFLSYPGQDTVSADRVAKRRRCLGRELGLLENIERFGALRAAYIGADNEPLSIGENLGALAAAVDMHGPSHVPAARLRQDESLPGDLHARSRRRVLQMRVRDRIRNELWRGGEIDRIEIE